MMRYRGWGFWKDATSRHEVAGAKAEQNFPGDHEEMLQAVKGNLPTLLPCRAVFGLPHNYFFKSESSSLKTQKKTEIMKKVPPETEDNAEKIAKGWADARSRAELAPATEQRTRRASPILIHAHSFPDGTAAIIQTLLPAVFLPPNDQVQVKAIGLKGGPALVPVRAEWNIIHTYLDRFGKRSTLLTGRPVP
jgi:CRISPR-associated protein Cmr1